MKKLIIILCLLYAGFAWGADNCETITVADTAIGFTAGNITRPNFEAKEALCVLESAEIRFWTDGTAPTSSVGIPLEILQGLVLTRRGDVINFKAIRTGGTSGTLSCCYN